MTGFTRGCAPPSLGRSVGRQSHSSGIGKLEAAGRDWLRALFQKSVMPKSRDREREMRSGRRGRFFSPY